MLLLKPITKPKLKSRSWYNLNSHLREAGQVVSSRKRRAAAKSLTGAMAREKLPGSENLRVFPDKRLIHKGKP